MSDAFQKARMTFWLKDKKYAARSGYYVPRVDDQVQFRLPDKIREEWEIDTKQTPNNIGLFAFKVTRVCWFTEEDESAPDWVTFVNIDIEISE